MKLGILTLVTLICALVFSFRIILDTVIPLNVYNLVIVADDDQLDMCEILEDESRLCTSHLWQGTLIEYQTGKWSASWPAPDRAVMYGREHRADRGMELSTVTAWHGSYWSCDDRTGTLYEIDAALSPAQAVPRATLHDGDGTAKRPLKCEWSTVVGDSLIVGSIGKPYDDPVTGQHTHFGPFWVKRVRESADGLEIEHVNWTETYTALAKAAGVAENGYLWHEAAYFLGDEWVFLPRRVSTKPYDEISDSIRGGNIAIRGNLEGNSWEVIKFAGLTEGTLRGFSAAKAVPGRPELVVALRTEEEFPPGSKPGVGAEPYRFASFICVLNLDTGKVVMPEVKISDNHKFEGIEITKSE